MILKVLLGLAAAFALFWTIKTKKRFPAIITLGMIVSLVLVFFPFATLQITGIYVYMVFVALAFIYGLSVKEKKAGARIIICLMSALIFAYWLWVLNHWHGNALLAPIFVLLVAAAGVIGKVKLKSELGSLVILAVDALAIIIENWMKTG